VSSIVSIIRKSTCVSTCMTRLLLNCDACLRNSSAASSTTVSARSNRVMRYQKKSCRGTQREGRVNERYRAGHVRRVVRAARLGARTRRNVQ
jgi:hypothetical protein